MSLLFVHDHKFRLIDGKYYSPGGLSDDALSRYTQVFGDVVVIARVLEHETGSSKYSLITNERVTIKNGLKLGYEGFKREVAKADQVICRLPSVFGNKAVRLAKKMDKPYLVELVACPWDSLWNHSIKGKVAAPYMTYLTRKYVREAKHVLYVTNQFLQERYPTNGRSVNCSNVVLTSFDPLILERRIKRIKSKRDKIIIGTAAAVDVKFKGQQFVIQALGNLKKQGLTNYEYQLVGAGDPSYLMEVAKKHNVENQIKFLGSLPHKQVFDWMDQIDLYVQPSRQEGLPRALIEAMSRGLPAFGARTGGIPELLEDKYIFSNTNKNIKEIIGILGRFDEYSMIVQAKRNFEESKKYEKKRIDDRRTRFFESFRVETV